MAIGRGTLGTAARHTRAERERTRGRSWEEGLQGEDTTAQAGERAAERMGIAMGSLGEAREGKD